MKDLAEFFEENQVFHGSVPKAMGTRFEALILGLARDEVTPLWDLAKVELRFLEGVLNRFDPSSEVSRVNASASVPDQKVSGILASLVRQARVYWTLTGGYFDVTKGMMDGVTVTDDDRLTLHGAALDFGGFAKGFFLKELKERLRSGGVKVAFADFGGSSIMTLGSHPFGDCWKVGVRNPFRGYSVREIRLVDQSLSTSGNSPGYSGHIIDPHDGTPVKGEALVSVICPDPLEAEVLSTAALAAGKEHSAAFEASFPEATIEWIA